MTTTEVKGLSKSFTDRIQGIVNDRSNEYLLELTLSYTNGPTFTVNPEYIVGMQLIHDYTARYRENVFMSLSLPLKQAAVLSTHRQNLLAEVKMKLVKGSSSQSLFTTEYIVVVHDTDDLSLRVNSKLDFEQEKETLIPIELNLIPAHDYHLRKKKFSTILHNATMLDALYAVAQIMEFNTVAIVPPHNTTRYRNLIIPALSSIADVFSYLQESNGYDGVYTSGIGYFIQNQVLYVYPKDQPLVSDSTLNFYNVGPNAFIGMTNYHSVRGTSLNIVINEQVKVVDTSRVAVENLGSWFSIVKPRQALYGVDEFNELHQVTTKANAVTSLALATDKLGVSTDAFTMSYHNGNNTYVVSQALYANGVSKLMLIWPNACPYLIRPNQEVHYLQDKQGVVDTKAAVAAVVYAFTRMKTNTPKFNCVADITLSISAYAR
jgi:hypothetical protein